MIIILIMMLNDTGGAISYNSKFIQDSDLFAALSGVNNLYIYLFGFISLIVIIFSLGFVKLDGGGFRWNF